MNSDSGVLARSDSRLPPENQICSVITVSLSDGPRQNQLGLRHLRAPGSPSVADKETILLNEPAHKFRFLYLRIMSVSLHPFGGRPSMTVTRQQLAASLAADYQITKRKGHELLDDLVHQITRHLKRGEKIRIAGLGILQVRKRGARMGRNPATGEAIKIKASKKVAFRASKELKMAV
jgi:DNA-binding protein HU-beta